ncbi:hypothetical protein E2C01_005099 [Portunus trituberculatus]|uniref:Uncharacterized protein n=1 Tax=Portunus trituberculatus TaxID=210409 RepID=A0A5B7CTD2_PORTR|nr:hypothetical protein [Portunus trituberculatus]
MFHCMMNTWNKGSQSLVLVTLQSDRWEVKQEQFSEKRKAILQASNIPAFGQRSLAEAGHRRCRRSSSLRDDRVLRGHTSTSRRMTSTGSLGLLVADQVTFGPCHSQHTDRP